MLFEIHGLILSLHHDARFLRTPGAIDRAHTGFERVIQYYTLDAARPSPGQAAPQAASSGVLQTS